MSSFTDKLDVTPLSNVDWRLNHHFAYHVGDKYSEVYIEVPEGFETDFASIDVVAKIGLIGVVVYAVLSSYFPSPFWLLLLIPAVIYLALPEWAKYHKGSILHDWLYRVKKIMGKPITRKRADDIFLEAMHVEWRYHKSRRFVAHLEYLAVRWFAWLAWK